MILAKAVLQILCWQDCFTVQMTRLLYCAKCQSWKRDIIQPNIDRTLPKVNQVIYTLVTICEPNIMILAQAYLQIFCRQGPIGLYWQSKKKNIEKGAWICNEKSDSKEKKKYGSSYFSYQFHISNFKILSLTVLDCMQGVMDGQMHACRGPNQYAPSTSWGRHKIMACFCDCA